MEYRDDDAPVLPHIWKGQELKTIGDLMRKGIDACNSPEEAQQFMLEFRAYCRANGWREGIADENVGYLSGYYSASDMRRIQDWFLVSHPIFGKAYPSPEEAYATSVTAAKGEC